MPDAAVVYHVLVLAVLLALLGIVIVNLRVLPSLTRYPPPDPHSGGPSRVAVLVPARNEEANIETCLRSLLAQHYPRLEVWIYDDASTDRTREIAERLAANDPRLHSVRGEGDPPPGWLGKAYALHQLYERVRERGDPDYLLFTDADVRLGEEAVGRAVAAAQVEDAGLLSVFPRQITVTWAERLAVPLLLHWAVYSFLPLPAAFSRRTGPAFAAANGQFMLLTREAYRDAGGHISVRSDILEDVGLARAVKKAGHRAILADAGPLVVTRMYSGAREVWEGYSKNVYAFYGYSPVFLTLGIVVLTVLYVAPPLLALGEVLAGGSVPMVALPLLQYGLAVLARLLLAVRFAYRPLDTLLHPAAVLYLIAISLNSMLWKHTGRGAWKGRATRG